MITEFWVDITGAFRCPTTKRRLLPDEISPDAIRVAAPKGERERNLDDNLFKTRKGAKKKETALGVYANKEWDKTIQIGSLVRWDHEIWCVEGLRKRFLYREDFWNFAHLIRKGLKEGDEVPSLLTLKCVQDREMNPADIRRGQTEVDANEVEQLSVEWLRAVAARFDSLADVLEGKEDVDVQEG